MSRSGAQCEGKSLHSGAKRFSDRIHSLLDTNLGRDLRLRTICATARSQF